VRRENQLFSAWPAMPSTENGLQKLWPVTLGFWLALRQSARATARAGVRIGGGSYLVLLPGAVLMAACPIVSTTRGHPHRGGKNVVKIARDFPVLGTGAGTFGSLYQLYRSDPEQDWAAYVHDDWLETRMGWFQSDPVHAWSGSSPLV
jgi:hypothetical protein